MGLTNSAQEKQQIMDATYLTISSPPPVEEIGFFLAILMIIVFGAMGGGIDFLRRFRDRPAYQFNQIVICYQDCRITVTQFISLATIHSLTGAFGAISVQLVLMSLGKFPDQFTEDLLLFSGVCVISGVGGSAFLRPIRRAQHLAVNEC